jgi:LPXTG-motif cell wall-anchored protein
VTETTAGLTESTVSDEVMGTQITNTTPPDEVEAIEVLPFTGSEGAGLLMLAASAIMLGGVFLISARREEG